MEPYYVSPIPVNNYSPMDLSNTVTIARNILSLKKFSGNSKKREHPSFMDTKEVDTASTPKM